MADDPERELDDLHVPTPRRDAVRAGLRVVIHLLLMTGLVAATIDVREERATLRLPAAYTVRLVVTVQTSADAPRMDTREYAARLVRQDDGSVLVHTEEPGLAWSRVRDASGELVELAWGTTTAPRLSCEWSSPIVLLPRTAAVGSKPWSNEAECSYYTPDGDSYAQEVLRYKSTSRVVGATTWTLGDDRWNAVEVIATVTRTTTQGDKTSTEESTVSSVHVPELGGLVVTSVQRTAMRGFDGEQGSGEVRSETIAIDIAD